jgi:hypothetical protein
MDATTPSLYYNGFRIAPFLWDIFLPVESKHMQSGEELVHCKKSEALSIELNYCHSFIQASIHSFNMYFLECQCKQIGANMKSPSCLKIFKPRFSLSGGILIFLFPLVIAP